ncbi:MAG: ABC transporter substrate-binding protein [Eubacteriales bacterium]|nr:ABC transporter substrate-binding protein [Eubacteriales bacterium]
MKKLLLLLLMMSMVLSSIISAPAEEIIKIGGIGVLTGPTATYGLAVKNGVDLFMEELNNSGGINGKKVEMVWIDSQGDPAVGQAAYYRLLENEGVVGIIGAVLTNVTKAVAVIAAEDGMPLISASSTAYEITTDRPNVFRTCFIDPFQAVLIARYMNSKGVDNIGLLYDVGDEYSKGLYDTFVAECEKLGLNIVVTESAAFSDVDFKSQLTNLKNANPSAIFLPYYGQPAAYILKQAKEIGLDVPFYGADGISNVTDSIGDYSLLTNVVYSDHFSNDAEGELTQKFLSGYEAKYGEKPSLAFSATAYDAALVLTKALEKAESFEFDAVVKAMKETNVQGVTGNITFDEHNDPIKSAFFTTFDENGNKIFVERVDP